MLRVGAEEDTRAPVVDTWQSAGGGDGGGRGAPPPALPPQHPAHRLEGRARHPQERHGESLSIHLQCGELYVWHLSIMSSLWDICVLLIAAASRIGDTCYIYDGAPNAVTL